VALVTPNNVNKSAAEDLVLRLYTGNTTANNGDNIAVTPKYTLD
jgi:hypothetical protein